MSWFGKSKKELYLEKQYNFEQRSLKYLTQESRITVDKMVPEFTDKIYNDIMDKYTVLSQDILEVISKEKLLEQLKRVMKLIPNDENNLHTITGGIILLVICLFEYNSKIDENYISEDNFISLFDQVISEVEKIHEHIFNN